MVADGRQAYVWSQASDKRFNQYGPNNLLHWEAMRYFASRGASFLHSPGAAGSSIGRFKESFRPEVLSYPFWIRDRSPLLRWGRALYQETYWIQSWYRYILTRQARPRPGQDQKS
jgi:lipid II:glycine glycyltransferase (peptidoglycan interpeptide bridge formation enzyme)